MTHFAMFGIPLFQILNQVSFAKAMRMAHLIAQYLAYLVILTSCALDALDERRESDQGIDPIQLPQAIEKSSSSKTMCSQLHEQMQVLRCELEQTHQSALDHSQGQKSDSLLLGDAKRARKLKCELRALEEKWRQIATRDDLDREMSALWHFPQISLFQLLNEVASSEHLYIIPADLASLKVSLLGEFAIPRQMWPELIDLILTQQGLGQRSLNPLCRQIYTLSDEPLAIEAILSDQSDLEGLSSHMRLCLLLSLERYPPSFRAAIEKFCRGNRVQIRAIDGQIALVGRCSDVQALLKISTLIARSATNTTYRVISPRGIAVEDLQLALGDYGLQKNLGNHRDERQSDLLKELDSTKLRLIPLMQFPNTSLLLIGLKQDVERACAIIEEIESQIEEQSPCQLFWYLCKNEKPQVLAELAEQIAEMLNEESARKLKGEMRPPKPARAHFEPSAKRGERLANSSSNLRANPLIEDCRIAFDAKSGYLVMSLPRQIAPKMQRALARLDIPKKMVRIDFALLERKITDCNRSGIQLLRLGSLSNHTAAKGLSFNNDQSATSSGGRGILEFALSKSGRRGYLPSYDLAYHFLLSQENVQINANPSILTINGVPAQLDLVEETSINSGIGKVDKSQRALQAVYQRATYGIKISITPHIQRCDDRDFIALEADLSFDTRKASSDYRPDVSTRHIKTTVRVADGQSAILGGLKQKDLEDNREKIPFLGELPGIGKLFGTSLLIDKTTEMFLFITPKIVGVESAENGDTPQGRSDEPEQLRAKLELARANLKRQKRAYEGG